MKCNICGEEFDASNLSLVFLHCHNDSIDPSSAIGIKGKRLTSNNLNKMSNYRQATAEALGAITSTRNRYYLFPNHGDKEIRIPDWQPDKDANHRDMVEDWLIKQGYAIEITHWDEVVSWRVSIWNKAPTFKIIEVFDKSKFIAFEKAFMEFNKQ